MIFIVMFEMYFFLYFYKFKVFWILSKCILLFEFVLFKNERVFILINKEVY